MSVSSLGASNSAYSYLQSLLQQKSTTSGSTLDPMQQLLAAFYPSDSAAPSTSAASSSATASSATTSSGSSSVGFSADTMASLISIQGQQWSPDNSVASQAQSLFTQFDANGDGQISQSEFESVFGSNADMSKVDGLFSALDANGDGSISQSELTQAAQQSHGHHHHAHGAGEGPGQGQGDGLSALLSQTDLTGATTQSSSNADGSTSTTITYADGSTVTMTTPASSSTSSTGTSDASPSDSNASNNLLERLIQLQAKILSAATSQTVASS
jgi:hypothetical protein